MNLNGRRFGRDLTNLPQHYSGKA
jgi:hypothetical protein